ncbi:BapA/Bap/LapF family prefix-like domain-containing protein [Acinetobacter soli]|uniref:BapA/Bap/LapF family prefix-like domain-containing protein n=1 Tax=Acinetobacter soli TaxID=487316 RepID=UPI0012503F8F|nr:BapA prefix-like domain-containing protein [Acinetobacter soli]MDQ9832775.1 BapA prefix-like domain-containing protein [Acinetobacter soli]
MPLIRVIGKENHKVLQELSDNSLKLDQASVVVANLPSDQIDEIVKDGTSMIIKLKDGEIIIIDQFFNEHSTNQNSLVLQDESQKLTWVQFIEAQGNSQPQLIFERVESTDALMYHGGGMAMEPVWSWAVVPLTAGGIALWAHDHKDKDHEENNNEAAPNTTNSSENTVVVVSESSSTQSDDETATDNSAQDQSEPSTSNTDSSSDDVAILVSEILDQSGASSTTSVTSTASSVSLEIYTGNADLYTDLISSNSIIV